MKHAKLILITLLLGLFLVNGTIYATRTPTMNDCLIVYTKSEAKTGHIYYFPGAGYHIQDTAPDYLEPQKVGTADGCIMKSDTILSSVYNTQACYSFRLFNQF